MFVALRIFLILIGVALTEWLFHIFFENKLTGHIYWLDLGVSIFICISIISCIVGPFRSDKFEQRMSGIGIRWVVQSFYVLLAMTGMILGYKLNVSPNIQFFCQTLFLLVYLIGMFLSLSTINRVSTFNSGTEATGANLKHINDLVDRLNIMLDRNPVIGKTDLIKSLSQIKDELKYIAPSKNELAILLEQDLIRELNSVFLNMSLATDDAEDLKSIVERCDQILIQRKKFYYK